MKAPQTLCVVFVWLCAQYTSLADTWVVRPSPFSNRLNGQTYSGVAYGNGLFVAVGDGVPILTSPDGKDWASWPIGPPGPPRSPNLHCVAAGTNGIVSGGYIGDLITTSADGLHWTNDLGTIGTEQIYGVTYGYGLFVAVGMTRNGFGDHLSYVLTSSNALDWSDQHWRVENALPSTNTLFAVAPAIEAGGCSSEGNLFVSVGDDGTILTSSNGVDWAAQSSGVTVALHAVIFHGGRFIVGGDSGVILTSADGVSWSPAAPTSFNIRGFASSGTNLVAVGNYSGSGRLQVSTDGLGWPGNSTEVPQPLNAITCGAGSFVAVGGGGLIVQSVPGAAPILSFTKAANRLVLSWIGDYDLATATNITGPYLLMTGASSPFTNTLTDLQRHFRLESRNP